MNYGFFFQKMPVSSGKAKNCYSTKCRIEDWGNLWEQINYSYVLCCNHVVMVIMVWSVREARLVEKHMKEMEGVSGTGYCDLGSGMFARNSFFSLVS